MAKSSSCGSKKTEASKVSMAKKSMPSTAKKKK
jgi:hypothetical protein